MSKSKKRRAISKTLRFEVFKRDGFACQYCGSKPPQATLEVDHVRPVSAGGDDVIDNLLTSCFDCNRGKGARELTAIPATLSEKAEILAEREEQIRQFNDLLERKRAREDRDIDRVEAVFSSYFDDLVFKDQFRESIRRQFLPELTMDQLEKAMHLAGARIHKPERAIKYFCGVCWRMIRVDEE